jgi:hypothetical protein
MLITHHDKFSISDFINGNSQLINEKRKVSPFVGLVRLFRNDKLISREESRNGDGILTNMTIAQGREFANQKLFQLNTIPQGKQDLRNYKINGFGVGSGGSIIDTNYNIILQGPSVADTGLYSPVEINETCLLLNSKKVVKLITSSGAGPEGAGSIEYEVNPSGETPGFYTVTKCRCIIDSTEPVRDAAGNSVSNGQSVKIDEACLYATDNDLNPIPFAHICFAPKFIERESTFIIEWYIIF